MADLYESMRIFCRVAETGGFSAAARDLDQAQSQTTRAVQMLEQRLGANLFHRTTRRLTLTPEGTEYLGRCQSILLAVEAADSSVGRGAATLSGSLRLFAPVSLGKALVVPRLHEFLDRHPALDVQLMLDDRPWDMIEHGIDVSIRIGPIREKMLSAQKLGEARRVVVASPTYWDSRGRPTIPAELSNHEAIVFRGPITVDHAFLVRGEQRERVVLTGRLATNSSEAVYQSLRLGRGFSIAPWWLVSDDVAKGNLDLVLSDWEVTPRFEIFAVYPETHKPSLKIQSLVDWLVFAWSLDAQLVSSGV
jgi:DNA-binding transcriptional LysR family regulator